MKSLTSFLDRVHLFEHKGLILSVLGAVAIVVVALLIQGGFSLSDLQFDRKTGSVLPSGSVALLSQDRDSDGDGIPDWEETLYGTDMHKTDTDDDGTSDGEEVLLGRDPSVPNTAPAGKEANDKIHKLYTGNATGTQALENELIAQFLASQSTALREATVKQLASEIDTKQFDGSYTMAQLTTTSDDSPEALRAYATAFGLIAKRHQTKGRANEKTIIENAIAKKDPTLLTPLDVSVAAYATFAKELAGLPVPLSLAQYHLTIVNGYDRASRGLSAAGKLFTDSVLGGAGYQAYLRALYDGTAGYYGIAKVLYDKGLTFTPGEPAAIFAYKKKTTTTPATTQKVSAPKS